MRLIDSHVHLNFPQFSGEVKAVLERARAAGVIGQVNIGTDLKTSAESISVAKTYPNIFATVGIHPHDANDIDRDFDRLNELAQEERVVAIGEIGLDYFRNLSPQDVQRAGFIRQLNLALSASLPVILHCRDAYDEMLAILTEHYLPHLAGNHPGIVHSFATGPAYAQKFIDAGFLLGINNLSTYPQNESIRETIRIAPLEALVLETDCPFLPPQSLRGQRSEPAHVLPVAELIAEIKGVSVAEVARVTTQNLENLLKISWK